MMKTGKQIAAAVGLQPRHIWQDVRDRGIEPQKDHGVFVLTDEQFALYEQRRADGYRVKRTGYTPKPKRAKQASQQRKATTLQTQRPQAVTVTTETGATYLYIPAPWEVPAAWEWRA